ncbi:tyrosine-type recombinase/integrase [Nocardia cyriacigeorgica]|uniref:tyrosine-type recombinase/integrase n=1 Tax=Nocardia cyriacigeorgica TaxID=135487 RepID=UPI00189529B5|nr:tyrosine-type recombinase/integrase [Nocardia cyriacigeorgica]MBF6347390.1 tyrosine-type recombinase/integrase [Nocardia cyriacigeorgica]
MAQTELGPGVAGKFSEPKWSESRKAYQIYCLVGEPYGDPSKVHASGQSKPKAIANLKKRLAAWKPRAESLGAYAPTVTVEDLCRAWLHKYENDKTKRPQNAKHYRREIEPATKGRAKADKITIVGSVLGKMKAADVRPFHIRIHLEQLNGFSYKNARQKSILRNAFQMLVDDGLRDDNPVNSVKGGKGTRTKQVVNRTKKARNPFFPDEPQPFTPNELSWYWDAERDYFPRPNQSRWFEQRYMDFTRLAYELAARPSEALAIRFDDVDFDAHEVTVSGTIVDTELRVRQLKEVIELYRLPDDEIVLPRKWPDYDDEEVVCVAYRQPFTKTARSIRTIKVGPDCMAMLRRRKIAASPGHRLVIPSRTGQVVRSEQMSKTWAAIVSGSGLDWSTVKTLRSTRATRVAEKYGLPAARLILGHEAGSAVTARHYVPEARDVVDLADAR